MEENIKDFRVSGNESLTEIENKTTALIENQPYKVRFSPELKTRGALGAEAAVLQLLGTWLQKNKHKKIFHSYQGDKPEDFKKLCSSIYGIAALSMVDEVWDVGKKTLLKGLTLNEAKATVQSLREGDFSNCFKSKYFGVPYIKTPRYDKEFDMPFYNGSSVIQADAFYRIIEKILASKIAGNSRFESLKNMIDIEDLSGVLWELLKNTHDHGRHDRIGNKLSRNFRALIIQQQDVNSKYFDSWCGSNPSKAQEDFRNNWDRKKQGNYYFLDLSVVDFGSGFIDLAKEKSGLEGDKKIFLKCLEKGWSRLPGNSRGDGLTKVLNTVQKYKGWLRIRSSNMLLEKTFVAGGSAQILSEDVQVMSSSVAGTSVHISLPLEGFKERSI